MKKRILHLHVKAKYFNEIKVGEKTEEYRLFNLYWCSRIDLRTYDEVHILQGYPRKDDYSKRIVFPWQGYEIKDIIHPEFGVNSVSVYAIRLSNKPLHPTPKAGAVELNRYILGEVL